MQLTDKAIQDLKNELIKQYGSSFDLTNEELNEIGLFLLCELAEALKIKYKYKQQKICQ